MAIGDILKKTKPQNTLSFFRLVYQPDMVFGVTADSAAEAESLMCEQIFHNQTIPGFPKIEVLDLNQVKSKFPGVAMQKVKQKGIWHPS